MSENNSKKNNKNNTKKNNKKNNKNNAPATTTEAPATATTNNVIPKNNAPAAPTNEAPAAPTEPVAPAEDTGKLKENIEKITPMLKKVQELQTKYNDASEDDKPAIDTEFQDLKKQILELQEEITKELESTDLKGKNVVDHLKNEYPDYHQIINDLGILNAKKEEPEAEETAEAEAEATAEA